jgi:RimJ/RimL family protein N-acetyltransferase
MIMVIQVWWSIVDEGDRIVATCHVSLNRETNTAEIGLMVSPDYRNQKIGQELFTRGITWVRTLCRTRFHCTAFLRIK